MTHESIYERQQTLDLRVPREAAVIGCGGVGSWVAVFLAMSGTQYLHLIDPDCIEDHNLNRIPVPPYEMGRTKASALAAMLQALRPGLLVSAIEESWERGQFDWLVAAARHGLPVFDCTDRFSVQRAIAEAIPNRIRVGYDGGFDVNVTSGPVPRWGNQEDTSYQVTPSWVVGAALAGLLAVAKACKWPDANLSLNLGDLMEGRLGYGAVRPAEAEQADLAAGEGVDR